MVQVSIEYCASKDKTFIRKIEMINVNGIE